jgi:hypothetical protein
MPVSIELIEETCIDPRPKTKNKISRTSFEVVVSRINLDEIATNIKISNADKI